MSMRVTNSSEMLAGQSATIWGRRTNVEKRMLVILVVTGILAICLFVSTIVLAEKRIRDCEPLSELNTSTIYKTVCRGESCLRASGILKNIMNKDIDPCDDFQQHVCGNWKNVYLKGTDTLNLMKEGVLAKMKSTFERLSKLSENDPKEPTVAVASFYQSCMDIVESNSTVEINLLIDEMGGWPLARPGWKPGNSSWDIIVPKAHNLFGISIILGLNVWPDIFGGDKYILTFSKPDVLKIPDAVSEQNAKLKEEIKKVACLFRDGNLCEVTDTEINDMIELKKKIEEVPNIFPQLQTSANIISSPYSKLYTLGDNLKASKLEDLKMTISELNTRLSATKVNWLAHIQSYANGANLKITENTNIAVDIEYVKKIHEIISNANPATLSNYFILELLVKLNLEFGSVPPTNREQTCFSKVSKLMPYAMYAAFANEHWPNHKEKIIEIEGIFNELKVVIEKTFRDSNWLDDKAKTNFINKLKKTEIQVGFPSWVMDQKGLLDYYDVSFENATDYFLFSRNLMSFNWKKKMEKVDKVVNRKLDWITQGGLMISAWNNLIMNTVYFPPGILNFPIYEYKQPRAWIYGALGSIIAHEIFHSFDTMGILFNGEGQLNPLLTDPEISQKYTEKTTCLLEQYSKITVNNINLPSSLTKDEDIPDNAGIKAIYTAFKTSKIDNNDLFPDLNYNVDQLFFISYATVWCEAYDAKTIEAQLQSDHTINKYRILEPLKNFPVFAKTFNCPVGSNMNPVKRCELW